MLRARPTSAGHAASAMPRPVGGHDRVRRTRRRSEGRRTRGPASGVGRRPTRAGVVGIIGATTVEARVCSAAEAQGPLRARQAELGGHVDEAVVRRGHHLEVRGDDGVAALAEEPAQPLADGRQQLLAIEARVRGERRHPQEHADEGDALHAEQQVRARRAGRASDAVSSAVTRIRRRTMSSRDGRRDRRPDRRRVRERRLDEDRPAVHEALRAGRRARTPPRRGAARGRPDRARRGRGSAASAIVR